MAKPYFRPYIFPSTSNCQTLDAQISRLRDEKDLVYRGEMVGSRNVVQDLLLRKEVQFATLNCSQKLEDESVKGSLDIQNKSFKDAEERIIGESNKKRQVMLIGGGAVLLIGLAIFVK
tara:strand:- start:10891 stop:11244 length:354 start_codon:yes stop_codon:yes gene_type:complete